VAHTPKHELTKEEEEALKKAQQELYSKKKKKKKIPDMKYIGPEVIYDRLGLTEEQRKKAARKNSELYQAHRNNRRP
jgi:hypothetical protein|tara:strand:+ start:370 stop:600 length:231 start_codon:yes stop_codon:yes gene_type:complete